VVIVDGGSSDGTLETLRAAEGITVLSEPGANIARGRNVAVRAAAHEVVAVTDADCVLAPDWLEQILRPLEAGADVSAGFYRPIADSFIQVCATAHLPEAEELEPGWMPSARSVAFRREVFESAGGYPEWLGIGEDMYLNHRWRESGVRMELARDAVVYWRIRPTLGATWRQYAAYAEGDAVAGMYPTRHAVRFAAYGTLVMALLTRKRWLLALAAAAGVAYARKPVLRAVRRLPPGSSRRTAAIAAVPATMAFIDAAKMWGYVRARVVGTRCPRGWPASPLRQARGPRTPRTTDRGR
jgi:GT2 family glycosyltransferase